MADRAAPKAVEGALDLREWDFRRDGPVQLDGQWAVYWQRLPPDLGSAAPIYLHVPGSWTGQTANGVTLPAEGYATYRLRVLTRPGTSGLGLDALAVRNDSFSTAFELRVDGKRITGNGV
ncbi:MAG TPA: sensor histidine kinase, partial [bacterium]